ncbi:MAG TPA: helix-turn-helix transcriptional regulator [Hyphomicrobiaceae bacterium]|nr:helix-turn-helix transcriptional regulator [Hyphomicrobiaceae bacterium]
MRRTPDIEESLRQAILNAGITRYRLSKLSGVTEGVLCQFVNRNRTITMETAAKLAAVLGLELTPVKRARKGR